MTDNIFDFSKDARIAELEKRLAEWAEAAGRLESQRSLAVKRVAELEREVERLLEILDHLNRQLDDALRREREIVKDARDLLRRSAHD